jgi:hypothetical protein
MASQPSNAKDAVLVRRHHQFVDVPLPCRAVTSVLKTVVRKGTAGRKQGYRIIRVKRPLFLRTRSLGRPVLHCWAGLIFVVCAALALAGQKFKVVRRFDAELPEPDLSQARKLGVVDEHLDMVRRHERGLIRVGPDVGIALLVAQIAWAWPNLKVLVAVANVQDARRLRDQLSRYFPDVRAVTGENSPAKVGRVVVATYWCMIHSPIALDQRDMVIAADALQAVGKRPRWCLAHALRARLYGLIAHDAEPAPTDRDWLAALFGFAEVIVPRHNRRQRTVEVFRVPFTSKMGLAGKLSVLAWKRKCLWHHNGRNRMIAKLVIKSQELSFVKLTRPDQETGTNCQMPSMVVLVESVEHGLALAKLLRGWPLLTGPDVCRAGLSSAERQALELGKRARKEGCQAAIVTFAGLKTLRLSNLEVIIRTDGGVGLPPVASEELIEPNDRPSQPLLIIDVDDQHHGQLRRRSRHRAQAYAAQGWYEPDADPVWARVKCFLATRPEPGRSRASKTSAKRAAVIEAKERAS